MPFGNALKDGIRPFLVMEVLRAANERQRLGGDVIHLEVGQPSGPAPEPVLEAAKRAINSHALGYTVALGLEILRQRIADHYRLAYGVSIAAEQVVITTGSSGGFLLAFLSAFAAGDRVALAAPGYPAYRNILTALGMKPLSVPVGPESRWQLSVPVLEKLTESIDGLIVASPSNPTGSMLSEAQLGDLALWCEKNGVRLISDEIYHGITFGNSAATAAGRGEHVVVVNSFSKYYGMTGWRLGWMVVPPDMIRAVECLQQNMFISPPTLSQLAAVAVFDAIDELDRRVAMYARNREILLEELPKAGFNRLSPSDGAFFLYADVTDLTNDSVEFCSRMLAETGVAITPGMDFDPDQGHHTLRFSFAGATADMVEAARRLKDWRR